MMRLKKLHPRKLSLLVIAVCVIALSAVALFSINQKHQKPGLSYDVVVVGAGPGGIAASIQAARMGAHVALLEQTDWIGGQMTAAGVGTMDEGNVVARKSGLYKEFVSRVDTYYAAKNKSVNTCYYETDSLCVDPQVGQTILKQMLKDAGSNLQVFTGTSVRAVIKSGDTVTGVVANGSLIKTKEVIDADEYGDILNLAGAAYRLGTGTSAAPNPSSCVSSITYTAVIKEYPTGVPSNLRFKVPPPGYNAKVASFFAAYLKSNGYDHFQSNSLRNLSFSSYAAYRGIPDLTNAKNYNVLQKNGQTITRTSLDLGNDYPMMGNLSTKFVSDPAYRLQSVCNAKLLTLQLLYYIQHDVGETNWSIANDEGYDTSYNQSQHCVNLKGYEAFEDQMSVEPYVREARRLVGTVTITGNELANAWKDPANVPHFASSIAVGYYPMDLHACHEPLETALDTPGNLRQEFSGGAFEIPLGVMIPEKIDGLLAAEKNISVSRQAEGAIREQPIAMDIGQAAGALAALAVKNHTQPRSVPFQEVQHALHQAGAITTISGQ